MANDKIKCVICKGHNDNLILFEGDKLKKCQQVLSVRVKHKLKYSDIELPTQINKTDGYHRQCYSSFTALMAKYRDTSSETDYASNFTSPTLSPSIIVDISENAASNLDSQTTLEYVAYSETNAFNEIPNTNIEDVGKDRQLKNVCFFCDKERKQNKGKQQNLHSSPDAKLYDKIIDWMEKLNNKELLQKINRLKSENKTIFYHHLCELNYLNDYNKIVSDIRHTSWHKNRNIHKDIFNHIVSTVEEEVMQKKKCVFLSSLCDTYNNYLEYEQKLEPQSDISLITNHYLEEKIQKHFKKSIKFISKQNKIIIIHKDCSLLENDFTKLEEDNLIDKVALTLRNAILKIEKSKLPSKIKTNDLITGECVIPDKLNRFFKVLMGVKI
ncbi:unnamed protein product [Pieris macdunnoughi]|uniref:Uncharacterized protein n=1 Tax=Pieris macdunnoughi TaxID=345717 RepID=A0A821TLG1_9NEOP|nr:unnamed protein product [Pieris macdunnoughi]